MKGCKRRALAANAMRLLTFALGCTSLLGWLCLLTCLCLLAPARAFSQGKGKGKGKAELPAPADGAYHYLREGESLWTVARTYDVPIDTLMARNGILSDEALANLQIGAAIVVPGIKPSEIAHKKPKARSGVTHELAKGETLWDVAREYKISVREIMSANRLTPEDAPMIRDGKRLYLPGVERSKGGTIERKPTKRELRLLAYAKRLGLGSIPAAGKLLHGRLDERWIRAAAEAGRFNGTLKWPVNNGWFVRGYGSGQGGYHKAMDIMGKMGWNVRAAAPGIVGYSGDKVKGFGNMVMLVHAGGFVTLYAHNSINFVRAGQLVKRNEVLAEVGSTGRSMGPHVHFELIHDNKNCDPAPLFRPGVKQRSGKLARISYAEWPRANKRPEQVRCAKRQKHPFSVMQENPEQDAAPVPEDSNAPDPEQKPPTDDETDSVPDAAP